MGLRGNRNKYETQLAQRNFKSNDTQNHIQEQNTMELYSRAREQEEEILSLREQIGIACMKELQLLNEKCKLERQFSELRMLMRSKMKPSHPLLMIWFKEKVILKKI